VNPTGHSFLAIDFETANFRSDSACSIGLVRVENGHFIEKQVHLIRPPSRFFQFSHIHGLTWNDVQHSHHFGELWPQIKHLFLNIEFVAAHNAGFDKRVLQGCCNKYGIQCPEMNFVCTMQLARNRWSIYPTRLSDVCRHLDIPLNHHEALSDAEACARIVLAGRA